MLANALTMEQISGPLNFVLLIIGRCNTMALDGEGHMTSGTICTYSQCK